MSTFLKIHWSVRMVIVVKMVRVIGVVGVVGIGAVARVLWEVTVFRAVR